MTVKSTMTEPWQGLRYPRFATHNHSLAGLAAFGGMPASRSPSPERDVFGFGAEIVADREQKQASTVELDFDSILAKPLRLHEDLQEGCGGMLWPAGMLLSKYMLKYHSNVENERIVEIGAGGGLVGLAIAQGCKTSIEHKVIISDQLPMYALMQKNIALNNLQGKVDAVIYDWGGPAPESIITSNTSNSHPSLVLAADCVYFEPTFPLLLQTLLDLIGPTTTCYFCFKKRRKADMRFIRDMTKKFNAVLIDYDDKDKDHRDGVFLYKVTKGVNR